MGRQRLRIESKHNVMRVAELHHPRRTSFGEAGSGNPLYAVNFGHRTLPWHATEFYVTQVGLRFSSPCSQYHRIVLRIPSSRGVYLIPNSLTALEPST